MHKKHKIAHESARSMAVLPSIFPMLAYASRACCLTLILALSVFPGCVTMKEKSAYSSVQTHSGTTTNRTVSRDSIDRGQTYELYFKPDKPVKCMMIGITGKFDDKSITGASKPLKIFFMVDRIIDVSKYGKNERQFVFTELAKNYDKDWEQTKEITICSKEDDPMMQINEKSRYRIRLTSFIQNTFEYIVTFKSDTNITFWEQ